MFELTILLETGTGNYQEQTTCSKQVEQQHLNLFTYRTDRDFTNDRRAMLRISFYSHPEQSLTIPVGGGTFLRDYDASGGTFPTKDDD